MSAITGEAATRPVVVIYGDFNCRFSAAASARAQLVEAARIGEVDWHAVGHAPQMPTGGEPVSGDLAEELDREIDQVLEQLTAAETGLLHRPSRRVNTNAATVAYAGTAVRRRGELGRAIFAAYWQHDADIADGDTSPTSERTGSTRNSHWHGGDRGCRCLIRSCQPWFTRRVRVPRPRSARSPRRCSPGRSEPPPSAMSSRVWLRRAHDAPTRNDGRRVLVDRIWPRGVSRDDAEIDHWRQATISVGCSVTTPAAGRSSRSATSVSSTIVASSSTSSPRGLVKAASGLSTVPRPRAQQRGGVARRDRRAPSRFLIPPHSSRSGRFICHSSLRTR